MYSMCLPVRSLMRLGQGVGNVFVTYAEVVGELLDDLDIEAVTAAGDEVGVGHARIDGAGRRVPEFP